jgi:hypothetical protein
MHIHQPRRHNHPRSVDNLIAHFIRLDTFQSTPHLDRRYPPIPQQQIALPIHATRRIHQPTIQN